MSGRIPGVLALTLSLLALFNTQAWAQSDPLDPDNPSVERIYVGGRLLVVDRLPAQVPAPFTFTDQTGVTASTLISSNIVQITGLGFPTAISISGTGSPQYRICSTSNCSSEVQTWTASAGEVASGQYVQLRLTSGAVSTSRNATLTIGGVADQWNVTTEGADTTPAAFSFTDQTNAATSTVIDSNVVQITGINVATSVSITGAGSPQFRTCSTSNCSAVIQTWTTSTTISNGQYLQTRLTSASAGATLRSATVTVGTANDQWDVTTLSDSTPATFNFTDKTQIALSTLTESNVLQITGINVAVTVTITGSGSPQYRTCSSSSCTSVIQNWTSGSGTISSGQYLQLRLTSAATSNTSRNTTVSVGTGGDTWYVTTRPPGNITLTTTGMWNVPAGVTSVSVTATGAGGGGGGGGWSDQTSATLLDTGYDEWCGPNETWGGYIYGGGGGGGGGAGAASGPSNLSVTPGANINFTIGAGGGGGAVNAAGSTGATTTFLTVSGSGGTGGGAGDAPSGGSGGSSGGTSGASGMVCEYWETISLSCGVIDSGDTCGSHSTGNASGGGSGYGAGGAGGLGDNFDGQSGGTAGSAGRIVITWP